MAVWIITRKRTSDNVLQTLAGEQRLPLLRDDAVNDFESLYGVRGGKSHLIFDREGHLLPVTCRRDEGYEKDPRLLLPFLRGL